MPIIQDVRSLFRRRTRPVQIDLTNSQAAPLTSANGSPDEHETALARLAEDTTPKKPARLSGEEVTQLVRNIGDHIDRQADRTEQLLEVMQRVPEALAALPEIQRQNSCLMEMLNDRFNEQKEHSNRFANTLEAMNKSSTRQTDVLGLIQQQLAENHASIMKRADALANLNEAIIQLADSNANTGRMLEKMVQINRSRDAQLTDVISRTQRWIVATLLCCGGASLAALVTALIALLT